MTLPRQLPPVAELRRRLRYEPETGKLYWRRRRAADFANRDYAKSWNTRHAGKPLESKKEDGYIVLRFDGVAYRANRVIWKLVTGDEPRETVDHRNLDRADNRWSNLRLATISQNSHNVRARPSKLPKGVCRQPRGGHFFALIRVNGARRYLGTHETVELAAAAYQNAANALLGEFARVE